MLIRESFRIQSKDVIAFVGGGGKTTAMFRLAEELVAQGKRVISTTTTRIFAAQIKLAPHCLSYDSALDFLARVREAFERRPHVLIVGETTEDEKALGVPPELVDQLIALDRVDALIYEADGARMRPLKAPAAHEPVIAGSTTLLVPVVGIQAIGRTLDDKQVHRAEIIARIGEAAPGSPITPELIARVVAHPEGGLKARPRGARVIALINQVENAAQLDSARIIARRLMENDAIEAAAIGAVQSAASPIWETHRRVAAIITAAGAGTRMQGRIKQLLPWRGKTLIENAIGIVAQSESNDVMLVLGAHADEILSRLGTLGRMHVVINRGWEEGHASSIRAGLEALSLRADAAIFVNADQPLLTPHAINQIIRRYRETDAAIVAPSYAGQRGSPVLFRRTHFDELHALRGEQGGRELLRKYPEQIESVDFVESELSLDVDTLQEYERLPK